MRRYADFSKQRVFSKIWTEDEDTIAARKKASQPPTDPKKMTFVSPAFPHSKWAQKPVGRPTIFRKPLGFSGV